MIIANSSSLCRHVALEVQEGDFTGVSLKEEDRGSLVALGFNQGLRFLVDYEVPRIRNPGKYHYPEYYLIENLKQES